MRRSKWKATESGACFPIRVHGVHGVAVVHEPHVGHERAVRLRAERAQPLHLRERGLPLVDREPLEQAAQVHPQVLEQGLDVGRMHVLAAEPLGAVEAAVRRDVLANVAAFGKIRGMSFTNRPYCHAPLNPAPNIVKMPTRRQSTSSARSTLLCTRKSAMPDLAPLKQVPKMSGRRMGMRRR